MKARKSKTEAYQKNTVQMIDLKVDSPDTVKPKDEFAPYRICDREHPNSGSLNIKKKHYVLQRYIRDWFHTFLAKSSFFIMIVFILLYATVFAFFAIFWYTVRDDCNLGFDTFNEALIFSITTLTTIGYGAHDTNFNNCRRVTAILFFEFLASVLLSAVVIGVTYTKISRGSSRAKTILFSDFAVLRLIDDNYYFLFQVVEMRNNQLVEGHIRCYGIHDSTDRYGRTTYCQSHILRLQHPSDEMGGFIFLALPSLIVHKLDKNSPFVPPIWWAERYALKRGKAVAANFENLSNSSSASFPERMEDVTNSVPLNTNMKRQSYDLARWLNTGIQDKLDQKEFREVISAYVKETNLEIMALIEGCDSITSSVVQARHSYAAGNLHTQSYVRGKFAQKAETEIIWDHDFVRCVTREKGNCSIDFDDFHCIKLVRSDNIVELSSPPVSIS